MSEDPARVQEAAQQAFAQQEAARIARETAAAAREIERLGEQERKNREAYEEQLRQQQQGS